MKIIVLIVLFTNLLFSQETIPDVLKKYNKNTVEYITVEKANLLPNIIFLDAREIAEFNVSHIKNAHFVGFNTFSLKKVKSLKLDKNDIIVVYCSIGIRSEKIGENLLKYGFKKVYNLYGGIFEWKNKGFSVVDNTNILTNKVHAFSKEWSKYLLKGEKYFEIQTSK